MFMVLSSWQSHCESSPGSFDECRRQVAANPRPSQTTNVSPPVQAVRVYTHDRHILLSSILILLKLILILPSHGG